MMRPKSATDWDQHLIQSPVAPPPLPKDDASDSSPPPPPARHNARPKSMMFMPRTSAPTAATPAQPVVAPRKFPQLRPKSTIEFSPLPSVPPPSTRAVQLVELDRRFVPLDRYLVGHDCTTTYQGVLEEPSEKDERQREQRLSRGVTCLDPSFQGDDDDDDDDDGYNDGITEGYLELSGPPVFVRTLTSSAATEEERAVFRSECLLMTRLHQRHLVRLFGVCLKRDPWMQVMEYADYGDLWTFVGRVTRDEEEAESERSSASERIATVAQLANLAHMICSGMAYLERNQAVHGALMLKHCVLSDKGIAKVGRFGLPWTDPAQDKGTLNSFQEHIERERWLPVEQGVSAKGDVWAFGVTLWELFARAHVPYADTPVDRLLYLVREGLRLSRPPTMSRSIYELLCECWAPKMIQRPTFADLSHRLQAVIKEVNPTALAERFAHLRLSALE